MMGFKKKSKQMTFAELDAAENSSFTNIRLERLTEIEEAIDWEPIKKVFDQTYKLGQPAYPPLMLFKCFLLQKWFRIDSDL